jgi:integrase
MQQSGTALEKREFTIDMAVYEWLAAKERTGSKRTRGEYENTMRDFRLFLSTGRMDLLNNPIDIARLAGLWASQRNVKGSERHPQKPVSASTYNLRLATLSSWYVYVQTTYKLDIPNPITDVPKRRVQPYENAVALEVETVEQGLGDIDRDTLQGLRDYALLTVALATGRRASEIAGLRWQDVQIVGSNRNKRAILTFHCKGNKTARNRLDEEQSAIFLEYLYAQHGKRLFKLTGDAPVWVSYSRQNKGQAISTKTLSNICATYLGTSKFHATRHTFVVGEVRSGAPLTDIANHIGHTDIRVTQLYTNEVTKEDNPYSEKLTARFGFKRKGRK